MSIGHLGRKLGPLAVSHDVASRVADDESQSEDERQRDEEPALVHGVAEPAADPMLPGRQGGTKFRPDTAAGRNCAE